MPVLRDTPHPPESGGALPNDPLIPAATAAPASPGEGESPADGGGGKPGARERGSFWPVAPFGRPDPEVREVTLRLVDAIGLHLICSETRCRRARRCSDPDKAQLPLCFWLHRGTCRFVVSCLAVRPGLTNDGPGLAYHRRPGATLLDGMRRDGWPIHRLARTPADGADEWTWERDPEACALVARCRGERIGD